MALIRLRVCAGWSEPLLVTYHIFGNLISLLIYECNIDQEDGRLSGEIIKKVSHDMREGGGGGGGGEGGG